MAGRKQFPKQLGGLYFILCKKAPTGPSNHPRLSCGTSPLLFFLFPLGIAADHMAHIIQSGRFPCQKLGGLNGSLTEYCPGIRRVLQGNHFVRSCKDHLMISHNGASPHSGNSDFSAVTLFPLLAPVTSATFPFSISCLPFLSETLI